MGFLSSIFTHLSYKRAHTLPLFSFSVKQLVITPMSPVFAALTASRQERQKWTYALNAMRLCAVAATSPPTTSKREAQVSLLWQNASHVMSWHVVYAASRPTARGSIAIMTPTGFVLSAQGSRPALDAKRCAAQKIALLPADPVAMPSAAGASTMIATAFASSRVASTASVHFAARKSVPT